MSRGEKKGRRGGKRRGEEGRGGAGGEKRRDETIKPIEKQQQ